MTRRAAFVLKRVRIASQAGFLGAFVYVFVRSRDPFAVVPNPFLTLDPLIFLTNPVAAPLVLAAIAGLLVLALLLGRVFCGWVCPMGSLVDLVDLVLSPLRGINPARLDRWQGRKTLARFPPALVVLGLAVVSTFPQGGPLYRLMLPVLPFVHPNVWIVRVFSLSWLGIGFLGFLAAAAFFARRLWCVYLCPLGALYGLLGSVSVFGLRIRACSQCGRCGRCPMEAADADARSVAAHQCTLCFDYEERCPVEGFGFGLRARARPARPARAERFSASRRRFLVQAATLGAGLAAGGILGAARRLAGTGARTALLRPPGVADEARFLQRCIRCLHCVQSCPTSIIRPAGLEAGAASLFTPRLDFTKAGCEYRCQVCQTVCPNAAIPLQALEQKQKAVIGRAVIDEDTCVVFKEGTQCLVCEELCPIPEKAIIFETRQARTAKGIVRLRYPHVVDVRCIGCGICQANCPAAPVALTVRKV